MVSKYEILEQTALQHQTPLVTVFGDVARAGFDDGSGILPCDIASAQRYAAALGGDQSRKRLDEFLLPVSVHACDGQYFTFPYIEAHLPHRFNSSVILDGQLVYVQNDVAGLFFLLVR